MIYNTASIVCELVEADSPEHAQSKLNAAITKAGFHAETPTYGVQTMPPFEDHADERSLVIR